MQRLQYALQIALKSVHATPRFLRAESNGSVNLKASKVESKELWTAYDNGDRTYSLRSVHKTWLAVGEGGTVMLSEKRSARARFLFGLQG